MINVSDVTELERIKAESETIEREIQKLLKLPVLKDLMQPLEQISFLLDRLRRRGVDASDSKKMRHEVRQAAHLARLKMKGLLDLRLSQQGKFKPEISQFLVIKCT